MKDGSGNGESVYGSSARGSLREGSYLGTQRICKVKALEVGTSLHKRDEGGLEAKHHSELHHCKGEPRGRAPLLGILRCM